MSRASITTGNILFSKPDQTPQKKASHAGAAMHIALIGDFSGRASRGEHDVVGVAKRKAIEVDRDNFEDVFSAMKVSLALPVTDTAITFNEFDDLHPDVVYERVNLFDQLRMLKRKLKKPELFQQAAEEIQQWTSFKKEQVAKADIEPVSSEAEAIPLPDNMLDAVLSQSQTTLPATNSPLGNIDHIIKDIVAPYVEAKADPRAAEMEQAVDEATSETLRKIMHASAFQKLESLWRSVYLLVRRIDTNNKLKVFLVDITEQEIIEDLASHDDLPSTALYQRFVETFQVPGSTAFSILQFDHLLNDTQQDARIASAMAAIAEASGGVALTAGSEKIAGCESFYGRDDIDDWTYTPDEGFLDQWQQLRQQSCSEHLAVVAPRFLQRLPYGKKTSPIDSFAFEELSDKHVHEYYAWGNGATLVTLLMAQSFSHFGSDFKPGQVQEVDELPLHIYVDEDDESVAKACAEIYMRDSAADKLASVGLLSLRSVKGKAAVIVPKFRSLAASGKDIFG